MKELSSQETFEYASAKSNPPCVKIIGCGGCGRSILERMLEKGINGIECIALDTDCDLLNNSKAQKRILIGKETANGNSAGGLPEVGKTAAEEDSSTITNLIKNSDLVIITAGMGGGTGSGAAPVVADLTKRQGCKTLAFVTTPFDFEGSARKEYAEEGIKTLKNRVDGIVKISNEKFLELLSTGKKLSFKNAFNLINDIIYLIVKKITDYALTRPHDSLNIAELMTVLYEACDGMIEKI